MKQEIESNYKQIKLDVVNIVEREMECIKNDPDLQHLVQQNKNKGLLKSPLFLHFKQETADTAYQYNYNSA